MNIVLSSIIIIHQYYFFLDSIIAFYLFYYFLVSIWISSIYKQLVKKKALSNR